MKYRKKPEIVNAIQWDGYNEDKIKEFLGYGHLCTPKPGSNTIIIQTLDGEIFCNKNYYILKDNLNLWSVCKPDIFEQTYEKINRQIA